MSIPPVPILSQMHPAHPNIQCNIILPLWLDLPRGLFPLGFLAKIMYAFLPGDDNVSQVMSQHNSCRLLLHIYLVTIHLFQNYAPLQTFAWITGVSFVAGMNGKFSAHQVQFCEHFTSKSINLMPKSIRM